MPVPRWAETEEPGASIFFSSPKHILCMDEQALSYHTLPGKSYCLPCVIWTDLSPGLGYLHSMSPHTKVTKVGMGFWLCHGESPGRPHVLMLGDETCGETHTARVLRRAPPQNERLQWRRPKPSYSLLLASNSIQVSREESAVVFSKQCLALVWVLQGTQASP